MSGILEPKREGAVEPTSWLTNRPTSQPTNQPTNQPTDQPANQLTNQSTNCNSMEQSVSWEANSSSRSQEIPAIL